MNAFTHIDSEGRAHMVDVTSKSVTRRRAVAGCTVVSRLDLSVVLDDDDLATIESTGRHGAKATPGLVPLCHPLPIDDVTVRVSICGSRVDIEAEVHASARTGVEMEALTAVSVAGLAVIRALAAHDPCAHIEDVAVWSKEGGKSGSWGRRGDTRR